MQPDTPVAWAPDGNHYAFVSGSHSIIFNRLLPPASPAGVSVVDKMLYGHTQRVSCLLFHPSEPYLVSAGDDCILLWDLIQGKVLQRIANKQGKRCHDGGVECAEWGNGNQVLITGSKDTTFILWRFSTSPAPRLDFLEQVTGHKGAVMSVVYDAATSKVASAGRDSTIKIWDCSGLDMALKSNQLALLAPASDSSSPPTAATAAATTAGSTAAGATVDSTTSISPTSASATASPLLSDPQDGSSSSSSPSSSSSSTVEADRRAAERSIKSNVNKISLAGNLEGHRGDVLELRFARGGRMLFSGARDNTIKAWGRSQTCIDVYFFNYDVITVRYYDTSL